jgi:hypothetical protein
VLRGDFPVIVDAADTPVRVATLLDNLRCARAARGAGAARARHGAPREGRTREGARAVVATTPSPLPAPLCSPRRREAGVGRIFTVLGCDGETTSKTMRTQVRRRPAVGLGPLRSGRCRPARGSGGDKPPPPRAHPCTLPAPARSARRRSSAATSSSSPTRRRAASCRTTSSRTSWTACRRRWARARPRPRRPSAALSPSSPDPVAPSLSPCLHPHMPTPPNPPPNPHPTPPLTPPP